MKRRQVYIQGEVWVPRPLYETTVNLGEHGWPHACGYKILKKEEKQEERKRRDR